MTRRCFGLDVHREFAQVAIWQDGSVRQAGQIPATPEGLRRFADSLGPSDEVALEATCNTHAIAKLLQGRVARVVISNPQKTRAIAEAKVKTDKVDAAVLAELLACDYLPSVWLADDATHALRRQVRAARAYRAAAHAVEEPGSGDPAPQPDRALPGRRPVRPQGSALAGRAGPARRRAPGGRGAAASAGLPRPRAAGHRRRARPRRAGQRRGQAADDDPRRRRDRRAVDRRRGRRLRPVRHAREAGQLPRAESARQAVRRPDGRIT